MLKGLKNIIKKRWYVIIIIFVICAVLVYQRSKSSSMATGTTFTVKRHDVEDTLSLSGSIEADEHVVLQFQTAGRLAWVGVKEGDSVKKYQGIASLDQRDLKAKLQEGLNNYLTKRWTFDQTNSDNKDKALGGATEALRETAQRLMDQGQFSLNNSVLDVELQNLTIEYANLWSPINGIVVRIDTPFAGVNIIPSTSQFEIINPQTIYFSATADQTDVVKLKEGMEGTMTLDAFPDKTIRGKITKLGFTPVQGETGTVYNVKIGMDVDNSSYAYRYGMTGDVDFILKERKNVVAIPSSSIKSEGNKKFVYRLDKGQKVKLYIQAGEEYDTDTIVTSGLSEGDVVYD